MSQLGADPALCRAASTYEPTASANEWGRGPAKSGN